ncbi:MAG: aspartate dehydrogenase [Deltaproteobacteria bacterium]|nr:aspartate dehydrogenase [Deltaproteobacteria bacterium]MBI3078369.1 aspartate dehydrogenase [Deltaproteobacteria bacterium]
MLKIGIAGFGVIGRTLAQHIDRGEVPDAELVAVTSRDLAKAREAVKELRRPPAVVALPELVRMADLVIESATREALWEIARQTFEAGKDLMVLSVGALLGRQDLFGLAQKKGCKLYIPSGAIAGLDGVKAAMIGRVDRVTITSRKPPRGLAGAPYLLEHRIDVERITEPTVLFEGPATEACVGFPANVNVAAALSLAGIGPEKTRVRVMADPTITRNTHDIEVEGEFGRLTVHIENVPSENPKTGKLAILSPLAVLKGITSAVRIGA